MNPIPNTNTSIYKITKGQETIRTFSKFKDAFIEELRNDLKIIGKDIKELVRKPVFKLMFSSSLVLSFLGCDVVFNPNNITDPSLELPTINYEYAPNKFYEGTVDSIKFNIDPRDYGIYSIDFFVNNRSPNIFELDSLTGKAVWNVDPLDTGYIKLEVVLQTDLGNKITFEREVPATWEIRPLFGSSTNDGDNFAFEYTDGSRVEVELNIPKQGQNVNYILRDGNGLEIGDGNIGVGQTRIIYTHLFDDGEVQKVLLEIIKIERSEDEDIKDKIFWNISIIVPNE